MHLTEIMLLKLERLHNSRCLCKDVQDVEVETGLCKDAEVETGLCKDAEVETGLCKDAEVETGLCKDAEVETGLCRDDLLRFVCLLCTLVLFLICYRLKTSSINSKTIFIDHVSPSDTLLPLTHTQPAVKVGAVTLLL